MAQGHDHDEHDHGTLHYRRAEASDDVLKEMPALHPSLAANLALTRRFDELGEEEKQRVAGTQREVETYPLWTPGYHAPGDRCATCGKPVDAIFKDVFDEGALPYGAFVSGLPVHLTDACLAGFAQKRPSLAPRALDIARRELMKDLDRPTPGMTQFFRHDVLTHPPFALEDWGNSVAEANAKGLDRATMKDMERLLGWVHRRLFHHH